MRVKIKEKYGNYGNYASVFKSGQHYEVSGENRFDYFIDMGKNSGWWPKDKFDIIKEPVQPKRITKHDLRHLNWIYARLTEVHGENPNIDYMLKFKEILNQLDADIIDQPDKLDIHEEKGDKSFFTADTPRGKFEMPMQDFQFDKKVKKNYDKKTIVDWEKELLEAFPLSQQMKDLGFENRRVFWPMGNKLDSQKLHKDISSTILSVLAKNSKINELSGREILCLVGEIADEVVKDVDSYKLNSK